jgi:tetratricopeptide (TPR) repeat protein
MGLLIALALVAAEPSAELIKLIPAAQHEGEDAAEPEQARFEQAMDFILKGRPADGVRLLDEIIASIEARHAGDPSLYFCARSTAETTLYSGLGASQGKPTKVVGRLWCQSYFFKGYALIDLNRGDEAKTFLDKAIALAPMNSQFLGERAEWYKSRHDWDRAYAEFETASKASQFSPDQTKSFDQRRAWRGMAYSRIEQGRLDEAEALLNQCLQLDPNDDKAKTELQYIASLRHKTS